MNVYTCDTTSTIRVQDISITSDSFPVPFCSHHILQPIFEETPESLYVTTEQFAFYRIMHLYNMCSLAMALFSQCEDFGIYPRCCVCQEFVPG